MAAWGNVVAVIGVTGGAGYIGGLLVKYLAARGYDVKIVDDGSGPVNSEDPALPAFRKDFASPEALEYLAGCDLVMHLAARSGVVACQQDPAGTRKINVEETRTLVEWCRQTQTPLLFASSFSVVGIPLELPVRETTPANPPHAYAMQKAEGEGLVRSLGGSGARAAVLRMSNLYGSYDLNGRRIAKGNVLNLYAQQAAAGGPLKVFKPGTQMRDYVFIGDVVAHWEAAARYLLHLERQTAVPIFNVASGETSTVIDVAKLVASTWDRTHPGSPSMGVEVVDNPRANVEILQPDFAVDATVTRQTLGLQCYGRLKDWVPKILATAATF